MAVTDTDRGSVAQKTASTKRVTGTEVEGLLVGIMDADGNLITSFGGTGGTQYLEGATDASIEGTAIMWEDTGDTLEPVSAASPLPVEIITSASIAVTGTFFQATQPISAAALPLPSGAATAASQLADGHNVTVDNASLAVTGTFFQATQPVSAVSLPLPAGAATAAAQLADGHNVTVDNADIAITHAALTELGAAINTSELDINIATDSVGIGGGTQYTEDAVAAADPIGNAQILVRDDAPVSIAADGDNVARRATEYGAAYTQIVDSSGNFIDTFGGSGGTSATDDGPFTAGSGSGTPAMGFFSADVVDAGDAGVLAMDASRRLLVSIEADNVGIGGGTQYTEDEVTANPIVGTATLIERDDVLTTAVAEADWLGLKGSAEGALWVQDFNSDAALAHLATVAGDTTSLDGKDFSTEVTLAAVLADTAAMDTNLATLAGAVAAGQMQVDIVADGAGLALASGQLADGHNVTVDNASIAVTQAADIMLGTDFSNVLGTASLILATQADNLVNTSDGLQTTSFLYGYDGTTWDRLRTNGGAESAALRVTLSDTGPGVDSAFTVDGSGVTQPVSAASLPLPSGAATSAAQLADGHNVTVDNASIAVTNAGTFATQVDGAALTALQLIDDSSAVIAATALTRVAIFDAADTQITSFGGGTEYTEDAVTPNPIVGTATMMERDDVLTTAVAAADWLAMKSSAEGALWVQDFNSDGALAHLATLAGAVSTQMQVDIVANATDFSTETTLASVLADTAAMDTNLATIAGAVATQMQVDIVANATDFATETTTALLLTDSNFQAAWGNSPIPRAEDGASGNAHSVVPAATVRDDALEAGAAVTTDLDYTWLRVDNFGALWTTLTDAAGAGISPATAGGQLADGHNVTVDNASIAITAASLPLPAGAATSAAQLADGHNVTIDNASGASAVNIQDGGNTITVGGTVTVTHPQLGGGTQSGAQRVTIASDSTGVVSVDDNGSTLTVDNAGLSELATAIVAHDATHAASAMGIGGVAVDLAESPTAVALNDFSEAKMTRDGQLITYPGHPNTVCAEYRTTATAQTNDIVLAAPGSGSRYVITGVSTLVDNASTTDPDVRLGFGATVPTEPTSGAAASTGMCPGGHPGITPGSGVVAGYAGASIATGGDNEPLRVTTTTNTAGDIRLYITYYVLNG